MYNAMGYTAWRLVSLSFVLSGTQQLHEVVHEISPDGDYRVVIEQREGGAAVSPFCTLSVLVIPTKIDVARIRKKRYEVYSTDACDSFADHSRSPKTSWMDGTHLKIVFSINHAVAVEQTVRLKKADDSGKIRLIYSMEE